jgi:phage terminase large subunit
MQLQASLPSKLKPLFQPYRYKVAWGGRGATKSWGFARALLILGAQKKLRILCTREVQKSIKDSVHSLLSDQVQAMGMGALYRVLETEIRGLNGTEFIFAGLSTQTVESIKSYEGVDICWVEEARAVQKRSWNILIPTIRKEGSEIWASFNPELDTDETYVRFVMNPPPDSWVQKLTWRDNPWFSETLRKEMEHLKKVDPEAFKNVWEGECRTAVEGAIYKNEINALVESQRIRNVPYDPLLKVHTIWDLGWNDKTTIIFAQRLGGELRIIDYYEESHTTYTQDVAMLESKAHKFGYRYGQDWLPHDGKAETKAANGKSPEEILRGLGRKVEIVALHDVEQGIKAARLMFPRCYFDKDKTARLVDCLKRYRRRINQSTNEPEGPLHDEHSHGADAFRGLAMVVDKLKNDTQEMKKIKYPSAGESSR